MKIFCCYMWLTLAFFIQCYDCQDIITTIAGTGVSSYSGNGGQATAAAMSTPIGVALDSSGNVYIAEYSNHIIRKVTVSTGIISTIAGTGIASYSGDNGMATAAALNQPIGITLDASGNMYIADLFNNRIRKVTVSTGIISTIAGSGGTGSFGGDNGQATSALLNYPKNTALDSSGNMYIADSSNHRIRKVTVSTGIITTIAGTGVSSYNVDNGPATSVPLYNPMGVAVDPTGNVYIVDTTNQRVLKLLESTNMIVTIAGAGSATYSGDNGPATSVELRQPIGVALDNLGNVYIADEDNCRIRKVTVSTGIITTIAGTGASSYSGDGGAATSAALNFPPGVALDSAGNIYIADMFNQRIRKVTIATSSPSTVPSSQPTTTQPSSAAPSETPTVPAPVDIITTIAGSGTSTYLGDGGQATAAIVYAPYGVSLDSSGDVYIGDTLNNRIRKVTTATGIITTIAGSTSGYSGDNGQATSAALLAPMGMAVDSSGNLYIADYCNNRIRKVTVSTSIITTIVGVGATGCNSGSYSGDNGQAASATLNGPNAVVLDSLGNYYISDEYNNCIRKVTVATGIITTIAGNGGGGYSGDGGQATSAALSRPVGVALDKSGNIYIADPFNHRIRKVTVSTGIITTIAGNGFGSYGGDGGQATSASLYLPEGVVVDASGNVYIADTYNNRVRKVTVSTGVITTIAGTGSGSYSGDNGAATSAALNLPNLIALDSSGNVYIADIYNNRIRKVTLSTGIITTFAGTGATSTAFIGDGGGATFAVLSSPSEVAVDSSGNVYVADIYNYRVRKVTVSTGIITTIAGNGGTGSYSGDGSLATSAEMDRPFAVTVDSSGNVYIADTYNQRIRKVSVSTGIITTIAGTGTACSNSGDGGLATSASFCYPVGVTVDASGNVYIADDSNHRIRKVTVSTGIISTVAGSSTSGGYSGDEGAATSAVLQYPYGVAVDSSGNVYIGDTSNHRIRKVTVSTGIITTIAGNGGTGSYGGDGGLATSASLCHPYGVALDVSGNVYIADSNNNRIRKLTVSTGIIITIAGTGTGSYSGDNGPATSANLDNPWRVALDSAGNMYIAEYGNDRIRKVTIATSSPSTAPTIAPSTSQPTRPSAVPSTSPSISPSAVFIITTIAGTGIASYSGNGGQATAATMNNPIGVALDSSGNVYIAEYSNHIIRKVTVSTGIISTVAGTGIATYSGDSGVAIAAALNQPIGITLDASGNMYIADQYNHRIRKVTVSTGIISTIAGSGGTGSFGGDNGQATSASLNYPVGIALDPSGNTYIGDIANSRVRKVTVATGIITTIAGTGTGSYSGDNGPATSAALSGPTGITLDSVGNVYFCDEYNSRVRKITISTGMITTIAGTSVASTNLGDGGVATSARLYNPTGIVLDSAGNMYIADWSNNRVRKVEVSTDIITTIAGSGGTGSYSGDGGDATSASLYRPYGVALDSAGNIYIAEWLNNRMRKVTVLTPSTAPTTAPSQRPSPMPSVVPTVAPSVTPSVTPTITPSSSPTSSPTSLPTSAPTSSPTASPTKRDNVVTNLLEVPLDGKVTKAKIKYYFGAFAGYFLCIYICLYLYSFLRCGTSTVKELYNDSYQSQAFINNSAATDSSNVSILSDLLAKNRLVQGSISLERELRLVKQASYKHKASEEEAKYSKGYREYVHQQRTLLGCSPLLYPEGCVVKIPCTSTEVLLPPGRAEDLLLFLCHNHPLFTCFYFMDGSKLGAHGTRILYVGKDVAVFVLYQFSNMLLQYFMLDGQGLGTFINLFIITPSAVSVGLLLKFLYTCPFTETVEFQRKYAKYETVVLYLGRLAILPIIVIMFCSLLIACLFSSNRDVPMILVNYFVSVQFYGIVLAIAQAMLLFIDGYYYKLSLFGLLDVLCVGQLYKERILAEQLVVDVDYAYRSNTYLFGLIKTQKILSRCDAIKAKWIEEAGAGAPAAADGGIELKGVTSSSNDQDFAVQLNPLLATTEGSDHRGSVAISMDAIYGTSANDEEDTGVSNNSDATTANPFHSLAAAGTYHQSLRLEESAVNERIAGDASALDDDAALFLEYQSLQSNDAAYDMNDAEISFEEWKRKRKQFKQGTRGSFVKAFQVFEEREQVSRENLEQFSSVKNTMKLHSVKVKNVLATTIKPKL